jgi:hypothetical protein
MVKPYTVYTMESKPNTATIARHDLDDSALGQYLLQCGGIPSLRLPVVTTKIGHGQSNPTYFLDDAAYVALCI